MTAPLALLVSYPVVHKLTPVTTWVPFLPAQGFFSVHEVTGPVTCSTLLQPLQCESEMGSTTLCAVQEGPDSAAQGGQG